MKRQFKEILPSYNDQIHKNNPYFNNAPNYSELAEIYPELQPFLFHYENGDTGYKFSEKNATKVLTKVLLKKDFQLEWDMPDNHLCPGITGRINYLNEIYDILQADNDRKAGGRIKGIDVGTGASCIYPLLGNALYDWSFIATDIDSESIANAQNLVKMNRLEDSIHCIQRDKRDFLIKDLIDPSIHFTMCNPPFFNTTDEIEGNPMNHTIMTEQESRTEGGEIAFIQQLITESKQVNSQKVLFTSLVGRKKSIKPLLSFVKENGFSFVGTFVLYQGRTLRWCLCWTNNPKYGQFMKEHPLHYKLFAKKKLTAQLSDIRLHFQLDMDTIDSRIREFCQRCKGIKGTKEKDRWVVQIGSFEYKPPSEKQLPEQSLGKDIQACLHIVLHENMLTVEHHHPVNPSVASKVIEQLENDIRRENRRWKRYLRFKE